MSEHDLLQLLRRVEMGATTARDAAVLARLLGVAWTEQLEMFALEMD